MGKKTARIRICDLVDFEAQPFKVLDDESMSEMVESVKENGVLVPIIVRPIQDGKFEIISGHRRKHACELAGVDTVIAIVKNVDDDTAAIMLVDSNLQREHILPSEKAYAYKLKLEAIKHQGKVYELTCRQNVDKLKSADDMGEKIGVSGRQIQRYIRLTELVDPVLNKVDIGVISVTAGVELSYLKVKPQILLNDVIEREECGVSLKQAIQIRKLAEDDLLSAQSVEQILLENNRTEKILINTNRLKKYFPKEYTLKQCEEKLWEILDTWFKG